MRDVISLVDESTVAILAVFTVITVSVVGGLIVAITKGIGSHLRKSRLDEMEATLKMEMIQRGMSADEISQVLEARMSARREPVGWNKCRQNLREKYQNRA